MNQLIEKIKESEGFIGTSYKDSLNKDTIGFGTLLPLNETEAELLLKHRLSKMIDLLLEKKPIILTLSQNRQEVLFEMAYQLGVNGVLGFRMMWIALDNRDYNVAADEMLDSLWYKVQTPTRAKRLSDIMRG